MANRLSEIEDWNVLLLEAGGDETEISDVPLMAAYLQLSGLDWKYKTEPQGQACLGKYTLFTFIDFCIIKYTLELQKLFGNFENMSKCHIDCKSILKSVNFLHISYVSLNFIHKTEYE